MREAHLADNPSHESANREDQTAPLDVFAVRDGQPLWLGSAEAPAQALNIAIKQGDGDYVVLSNQTGRKKSYKVTAGSVAPTPGKISAPSPTHELH